MLFKLLLSTLSSFYFFSFTLQLVLILLNDPALPQPPVDRITTLQGRVNSVWVNGFLHIFYVLVLVLGKTWVLVFPHL